MKAIDNDIKKIQDDITEVRNTYAQLAKKEGTNFMTQDISSAIYSNSKTLDPKHFFVEQVGSEMFSTVIVVVHKTQIQKFQSIYEKVLPWDATIGQFSVVPRSAKPLNIEDSDGYQLWRIVVLKDRVDEYINAGKKDLVLRKFTYDFEGYKKELQVITELEGKLNLLKTQLATKSNFAFSELMIALMHLKVLRAFIDGVLRFGIPPKFFIGSIEANKGQEKHLLAELNRKFDDTSLAGMYGGAGKEEDSHDEFYSFVSIPLTTPIGI